MAARPAARAQAPSAQARRTWSDKRVERLLGALASAILVLIAGMVIFVFAKGWPAFSANGLAFFGTGGNVDRQLAAIFSSPAQPENYQYTIRIWPLIYGTALTTLAAVSFGMIFALLSAVFIVEFAPDRLRRFIEPIVRLLAAVPSVVYGLIGVLVFVPFVGNTLITPERKKEVEFVVSLTGSSLLVAVAILTVMITPIMIAIITDALRSVPRQWTEGSAALGVNRWRTMWRISVRTARPAIIAAGVLATARALGEAIMLSMVSGSVGFAPNPLDGLTFFVEPTRPLAATVVENFEGSTVAPFGQTLYALASLLLLSAVALSVGGWAAKQPLRKYGVR